MVSTLTFLPFILHGSVTILSALDFLGFGLPPGSPSLGELRRAGQAATSRPPGSVSPHSWCSAVLLSLLIFIGEAVRDAFDPRKKSDAAMLPSARGPRPLRHLSGDHKSTPSAALLRPRSRRDPGAGRRIGSGKSVTALSLLQLLPCRRQQPTGSVLLDGKRDDRRRCRHAAPGPRRGRIAMVFQEPMTCAQPAASRREARSPRRSSSTAACRRSSCAHASSKC